MKKIFFGLTLITVTISLLVIAVATNTVTAQKNKTLHIEPAGPQFVRGRVLVKFRSEIGNNHAHQIIAALGARDASEIPAIGVHVVELPEQASETAFAKVFDSRPEVEFAEPDRLLGIEQIVPDDPLYADINAWSLPKIAAPEAWSISTGSSNITIAILDTGIDSTHPELAPKLVPGWNIYNNNSDTTDIYGHGTAVAGTAAATSNNGVGVASIAWGCLIMPVRISDNSGLGSYSNIASGLTWAADHGARVANVSYNVTGSRTVSSAARYFQGKGGVVASAAGNQGIATSAADDPYILTVGATDSSDNLFSWSNRGNNLDLVAPGNVFTTLLGGLYGVGGGTSFASPIVAGAAALVLSVNPNLTPGQVQDILKQQADDQGAPGWDSTFGWGRVNLARALGRTVATGGGHSDATAPSISITSPSDNSSVSGTVTVLVNASDDIGVAKVELYVDGSLYATSATAPFSLKWNTRKFGAGFHTMQAKAYDAAGNKGESPSVSVCK
jgi:thermitase